MTWPTKDDFVDGDVLTAAQVNNIADNLNLFDPTLATNGQVWTANGSGSGSYASVGGGMTEIATGSLASLTSLTISSIPTTYRSLSLWMYDVYGSTTGTAILVRLNNNVFSNNVAFYQDSGATATFVSNSESAGSGAANGQLIYMSGSSNTRNQWIYDIPNYAVAPSGTIGWHVARCTAISTNPANSNRRVGFSVAHVYEEAAITSIVIEKSGGASVTAGTYILWGIK